MTSRHGYWIVLALALGCVSLRAQSPADDPHLRALQVLRKTMLAQERRNDAQAVTNQTPPPAPTFASLEKQYLDGKMTARQFQQYVLDYRLNRSQSAAPKAAAHPASPPTANSTPANAAPLAPVPPASSVVSTESNSGDTSPGTNAPPPATGSPALNRLAEMEARMDRIIQEKAARDEALTNRPPSTSAPKTKREKLNELLRERIAGKITEEEYKAQWSKIAAEKD